MSPSPEHEADTGRKRWRRWLQISLRTLLLLIALVAVAALAASWYEAPFRRQREAMAAIEQAGGSYQAVAAGPAWLRRLFGEESFRNVTLVNVADSDDPASYVDHIARLPALETLVVGGPGFTDEHVRRLHGLATLSGLVLDCTEVTDDGIAALRQALGDVEVYRSQRRSIRWLEDLGCRLQKKPPPHSRLQPLVGSEWFDELMAVDIANVPFGDADTAILKPLHGLRGLTITGLNMVYATPPQGVTPAKTRGPSGTGRAERSRERPKVTDAGLAWLQGLSQLGRLILDTQPDISDAGLDHLQGLKQLYQINLNGTGVTDAGLAKLKELDKLFWLGLRRTRVTDAGLVHLQGLPRLTEVFLADTAVSDAGVATLAALPLESLDLDRTPITDAALAHLKTKDRFIRLTLNGTRVTDAGLAHIANFKRLDTLELGRTQVSGRGLAHLAGLAQLTQLDLSETQVDDAALVHLQGLIQLDYLHLSGTKVTDAGLVQLKTLTKLRHLLLRETSVTAEGESQLRKALPTCTVVRSPVRPKSP